MLFSPASHIVNFTTLVHDCFLDFGDCRLFRHETSWFLFGCGSSNGVMPRRAIHWTMTGQRLTRQKRVHDAFLL